MRVSGELRGTGSFDHWSGSVWFGLSRSASLCLGETIHVLFTNLI